MKRPRYQRSFWVPCLLLPPDNLSVATLCLAASNWNKKRKGKCENDSQTLVITSTESGRFYGGFIQLSDLRAPLVWATCSPLGDKLKPIKHHHDTNTPSAWGGNPTTIRPNITNSPEILHSKRSHLLFTFYSHFYLHSSKSVIPQWSPITVWGLLYWGTIPVWLALVPSPSYYLTVKSMDHTGGLVAHIGVCP